MRNKIYIVFLVLCISSCNYFFKETDDRVKVARVNGTYLYYDDIKDLVSENTSKEDSILLVQNYINRWATQQLFVDGAMLNLNETQQASFNKLVTQYKNDLYTKAYIEALVKRSIDTTVTDEESKTYYQANEEVFKLNEDLIKFRYVHVDENMIDFNKIEQKFKRYNKIDKNELLKKSNFVQLKDSLGVYLMQINDVLLRGDTAPLEYVKPTIDQIVINQRKLELIKQLEKDITQDAIKNKQFEIYN